MPEKIAKHAFSLFSSRDYEISDVFEISMQSQK